ncbi:hypothetical protein MTX20_30405 [Bradyrhizobium sp. ISRA435]|nr:hypothetical protein MTX20_30405 [Bradyrhizobium sp. ISRA435]
MPPLAEAAGDRDFLFRDRREQCREGHAGQLLQLALETIELAVGPTRGEQGRIVGAGHRAVIRIVIMTNGIDLDSNLVAGLPVGADMGEGGIAAKHPAVARIHDAPPDRIAKLKPDLVEALEQAPRPRQSQCNRCLARFIT